MIYSAEAMRQIDSLRHHYDRLDRPEAIENLITALINAEARIENNPAAGLQAPRPYPALKRANRLWISAGHYWIAYDRNRPPTIMAVMYDTANIPGRV